MNAVRDVLLGARLERRYRIDALIARGGMSSVYLGMDLRLDRPVAVKVMDPRYSADQEFLSRFEFEARSVARLKDPGLVPVYDQGVDGDYAFLVMELVEGGTLRELLRERGPMPPHAAAAVAIPVLGGLGAAHAHGLVHRDVKPENVLISENGEVKVVDFGLVRAIAAAGITSNSVILGTAAYLSPEQVESADADARSDIYSMGILIFEMLTGTTPFTGDTALGLAYARLQRDVPPPSRLIPGVPREFDELVLTATARRPEARYADGDDMLDALVEIVADLGLPPFTVPAPTRSAERETVIAYRNGRAPVAPPAAPLPPTPRNATRMMDADPDPVGSPRTATRFEPRDDDYRDRDLADDFYPDDDIEDARPRPALLAMSRDFDEIRSRSRRRAQVFTLLVLVLGIALAAGGWWLGSTIA
ncbi:protein kinase domain-containing protein [Williamsia maris]|uniref:Serine/threonine protein kinase n=1 Tax=Williamsia maris TaxID=72806 RepID=A0ABT1HFG2_9NOCA|nr:protein kinase [Williamsia maris]MCP2176982.1 serine/threonine protein kinase [Williamsia maris]